MRIDMTISPATADAILRAWVGTPPEPIFRGRHRTHDGEARRRRMAGAIPTTRGPIPTVIDAVMGDLCSMAEKHGGDVAQLVVGGIAPIAGPQPWRFHITARDHRGEAMYTLEIRTGSKAEAKATKAALSAILARPVSGAVH